MAANRHQEVTLETIQELKARGFTHIQFELKDSGSPTQAIVEVIPGTDLGFELGVVSLISPEISDYFQKHSPMAKYIIDRNFLS